MRLPRPWRRPSLAWFFQLGGIVLWPCFSSPGAHVTLLPAADATLIQLAPTNSAGGADFFNAGTTQNRTRNRGLIRFELSNAIPAQAQIISASLAVQVLAQSLEAPASSVFGLHRLLRAWGEGSTLPDYTLGNGGGGWGGLAAPNDATWTHRFAGTDQMWNIPGGAPGIDFVPTYSSSVLIETPAAYLFETTVDLLADVQLWVDHLGTNFGWMIMTESEEVQWTARKFASRENPGLEPQLAIDYLARPFLTNAEANGTQAHFTFMAEPGQNYVVQRATNLPSTQWTTVMTVTPPAQPTNIVVNDALPFDRRFYRVSTY